MSGATLQVGAGCDIALRVAQRLLADMDRLLGGEVVGRQEVLALANPHRDVGRLIKSENR